MNQEFLKWLSQMPNGYKLVGHKDAYYNGQSQVKLFIAKEKWLWLKTLLFGRDSMPYLG